MGVANSSNYLNIQNAVRQLITTYTNGVPGELGDYSKITTVTPNFVIAHARLWAPQTSRHPQYEDLDWFFPIHFFFDYTSDDECHRLVNEYRVTLIKAFMERPLLDLTLLDGAGNPIPYPNGQSGHAKDSKLLKADLVNFISLDEKTYAVATYEAWVQERLLIISR